MQLGNIFSVILNIILNWDQMGFPTWKVSVMRLEVHNVDFTLALEKIVTKCYFQNCEFVRWKASLHNSNTTYQWHLGGSLVKLTSAS